MRAAARLISLAACASATLVLSPSPPRGFNTFDTYGYAWLNASGVEALLRALAASPLAPAGYDLITGGFSGWSQSPLANGSAVQHLDAWGRPTPAPERFPPGSMAAAAAVAKSLGIKFGLWIIRGVHATAVAQRLPVKGAPGVTADMIVDQAATGGGANGSCLWDAEWLGVNGSHPAAAAWYASQVENLVELGAEVIEADCMMCEPCYWAEMALMSSAVRARPEPLTLYFSPGGGNQPADSARVAAEQLGTFYRTLTDFHGEWYNWGGVQQAAFIAGNFTAARLHGANATWPDLDMIPLGPGWWNSSVEQNDRGQLIATLWMVGRYPLFAAGALPMDETSLAYYTNPLALALNQRAEAPAAAAPTRVWYEGNCTCTGGAGSCTIPHGPRDHPAQPCLQKWAAAVSPDGWTACAVLNIGEDAAATATSFAELGLPAAASDTYRVRDVWSGDVLGVFAGDATIPTHLRPHAATLLQVTALQ